MIRSALTLVATLIVFTNCVNARPYYYYDQYEYRDEYNKQKKTDNNYITSSTYDTVESQQEPRPQPQYRQYTRQTYTNRAEPKKRSKSQIDLNGDDHISIYQNATYAFGSSGAAPWLTNAKKYVGTGPEALGVRRTLWCAASLNVWLKQAGFPVTGSDMASSFMDYGTATTAKPGAIALIRRGGGIGHVGIVVEDLGNGSVKLLSGNHSGKTAYGTYSKSSIAAYRWPTSGNGTRYTSAQ